MVDDAKCFAKVQEKTYIYSFLSMFLYQVLGKFDNDITVECSLPYAN